VMSASDSMVLELTDGVFKQICQQAQANPNQPYLLIIDEINRANVSKVLGELMTILEHDKRNDEVVLPQSKARFSIPDNVYIIGTMNTADRSIMLMDAALRRRFAFIELLPNYDLPSGTTSGELPLDEFLETLNSRISDRDGREKQIGHSYFLDSDGNAIDDPEEFAWRFEQEILPLLQEYCYENYSHLAEYIGSDLVNAEKNQLNHDLISDPMRLIEALKKLLISHREEE